jgi:hypothetical protein
VRLGGYVCPLIAQRFGRLLDRVAIIYPLVLVALVVPIAAWLVPDLLAVTPSLLVGFVVARSLFALRQMEAYSYADHRAQLRQAAMLVLGVMVILLLVHRIDVMLMGIALGLVVAALVGGRARISRPALEPGATLCFEQFVDWLKEQPHPLRFVLLDIDRRMTSVGKVRLALLKRGINGPTLQPSHHQLLVALEPSLDSRELRSQITIATAGTLSAIRVGDEVSSGRAACAQLCDGGPFGGLYGDGIHVGGRLTEPWPGVDRLASEFTRAFPDGVRLTGARGTIRSLGPRARGELHAVLSSINANRPQRGRHSRFIEVATYRTKGEVTELFLLPRSSPRHAEFLAFRRRVIESSRLASLREVLVAALHHQ